MGETEEVLGSALSVTKRSIGFEGSSRQSFSWAGRTEKGKTSKEGAKGGSVTRKGMLTEV